MRSISLEAMQALFAQNTDEVFVFGVVVNHPDWATPVRLVQGNDDISYGGDTWVHYPFTTTMLPQQESSIPSVTLSLDNTTLEFIEGLRSVSDRITVDLYLFRISSVTGVNLEIGPMYLFGGSFEANQTSINITLSSNVDYLNEPGTKDSFNPFTAPGIF